MFDASFRVDIRNFDSSSGPVRSLTYDAISKPPHGHKMSQLCNDANASLFFFLEEDETFKNQQVPGHS